MKIGIIGAGTLGSWFAERYRLLSNEIFIADIKKDHAQIVAKKTKTTAVSVECLLEECDEIAIAVSLSTVSEVIHSYSFKDKIVYDFASIKRDIVNDLSNASTHSYSLHPMWGGSTPSFKDQNLIMIPTHNNDAYNSFFREQQQRFSALGCNVHTLLSGEEHDRYMAWTLGTYHLSMLTLGSTVAKSGLENHRLFAGTTQRAVNIPLEAVLASNPELYAQIQMFNPYTREVIDTMQSTLAEYHKVIVSGDCVAFAELMTKAKECFMQGCTEPEYTLGVQERFKKAANLA